MSEIQRYDVEQIGMVTPTHIKHSDGDWAKYSDHLLALKRQREALEKENERLLIYAKQIAEYLYEKYYKSEAPEWEVASTLSGVLSQIDNMVAGRNKPEQSKDSITTEKSERECRTCGYSTLKPCPHLMNISCGPAHYYKKWLPIRDSSKEADSE